MKAIILFGITITTLFSISSIAMFNGGYQDPFEAAPFYQEFGDSALPDNNDWPTNFDGQDFRQQASPTPRPPAQAPLQTLNPLPIPPQQSVHLQEAFQEGIALALEKLIVYQEMQLKLRVALNENTEQLIEFDRQLMISLANFEARFRTETTQTISPIQQLAIEKFRQYLNEAQEKNKAMLPGQSGNQQNKPAQLQHLLMEKYAIEQKLNALYNSQTRQDK